jgi:hypothetical protein
LPGIVHLCLCRIVGRDSLPVIQGSWKVTWQFRWLHCFLLTKASDIPAMVLRIHCKATRAARSVSSSAGCHAKRKLSSRAVAP